MIRSPGRLLGRIAGIPVHAHWTTALIGAFVWYILATSILPGTEARGTDGALMLLAVLGTAAFLGSILAHELAHAVVARRFGLGVESVSLELLGGIARLDRDPRRPREALGIAAAGPLASIALGAIGIGLTFGLAAVAAPTPLRTLALWLGGANLVLGVFNLLPGLPLDGGRILQALLWGRSGDEHRATVTAARAGRVVGYGLMGYGAAGLFGATPGGLWTLFLGWFIQAAAGAELHNARAMAAVAGVRVGDVMSSPVTCVQDHLTLTALTTELPARLHSTYPVQAFSGRISGMVTIEHLRTPNGVDPDSVSVREVMTPASQLTWATPDEPLVDVLRRAEPTSLGRIFVGHEADLKGLVTPTDLQRAARFAALLRAGRTSATVADPAPSTPVEPTGAGIR
ncbi:MAG: site-2 protease family protein [Acidimicrobiales bacterium]|nr:site-2 protease family protein [Acidimicrobiales bacterium]